MRMTSIGHIQHIPTLPNEKEARRILDQLAAEFGPIIERRGWRVLALTEMCCCGDGDAHINTSSSSSNCRIRRSKGRGRIMSHNVQGYNMARGDSKTSLGIHIRLRRVKSHSLLPYSDIAGVMAHELAHIRIGAHSANFYELMEEIASQHAIFVASGNVLGKDGFPLSSSEAYRLGGLSRRLETVDVKRRAAMAAEKRSKLMKQSEGAHILGSKTLDNRKSEANLTPSQLAAIAAERRQQDSRWCHEVTEHEIIEILDENNDDYNTLICQPIQSDDSIIVDRKISIQSQKRKAQSYPSSKKNDLIDLTGDSLKELISKDDKSITRRVLQTLGVNGTKVCRKCKLDMPFSSSCEACNIHQTQYDHWECVKCTYQNKQLYLSCGMCGNLKVPEEENLRIVSNLAKEKIIGDIKRQEVKNSQHTFNGFNIYGNSSYTSSKMKHMT